MWGNCARICTNNDEWLSVVPAIVFHTCHSLHLMYATIFWPLILTMLHNCHGKTLLYQVNKNRFPRGTKVWHENTMASTQGISYKTNNIFTNISRILMNFRGRCHPDMLHSDHQQINKKSKRKQNGQNTFSK